MNQRKTDIEELVTLREQGWSLSRIAKHFGCSKPNISQILKRLFPPPPPPMPECLTKLTEKERHFGSRGHREECDGGGS